MRMFATTVLPLMSLASPAFGQAPAQRSTWEGRDGYRPFHWDPSRGRILLEQSRLGQDVLYFTTASKGLGSVELGLEPRRR